MLYSFAFSYSIRTSDFVDNVFRGCLLFLFVSLFCSSQKHTCLHFGWCLPFSSSFRNKIYFSSSYMFIFSSRCVCAVNLWLYKFHSTEYLEMYKWRDQIITKHIRAVTKQNKTKKDDDVEVEWIRRRRCRRREKKSKRKSRNVCVCVYAVKAKI